MYVFRHGGTVAEGVVVGVKEIDISWGLIIIRAKITSPIPMKKQFRLNLATAGLLAGISFSSVQAATYTDATSEGSILTAWPHLDITSVEVNNTASDLSFKISLAGNPVTTDWGKYMIGIVTGPGGDPAGNGWSRPIGLGFGGLGMNYWVGSWVDSGNGAEIRNWTGSLWNPTPQSATYGANPDLLGVTKDDSSVTVSFKFGGLGLNLGDTFIFDVYSSGGGGSDSAIDALANPLPTVANWSDPYNSGFRVESYTLVPEPSSWSLLAGGALLLLIRRRG